MQSTALFHSPTSLSRFNNKHLSHDHHHKQLLKTNHARHFNPGIGSASPSKQRHGNSHVVSPYRWQQPRLLGREQNQFEVRATAVPESAGGGQVEKQSGGNLMKTVQLGALFGLWYLFNIYFNIYNKQVLKVYPFPVTVTTVLFAVGTLFDFWSAMASNLTNQSRNVLSKKVMVNQEASLDNITLFSIITIMSFILMVPITLLMEGVKLTPYFLQSAGLDVKQVYVRSLLAALCFHAYQHVSYMILQRVSPVTHSVGNCVKRVVVIVSSVIFFKTPVSPINSLGTGIALAGVFLYSQVKRIKPKTA